MTAMMASHLLELIERVPDDPFYTPRRPLWLPPALDVAPALDAHPPGGPVERRFALLLNPLRGRRGGTRRHRQRRRRRADLGD